MMKWNEQKKKKQTQYCWLSRIDFRYCKFKNEMFGLTEKNKERKSVKYLKERKRK